MKLHQLCDILSVLNLIQTCTGMFHPQMKSHRAPQRENMSTHLPIRTNNDIADCRTGFGELTHSVDWCVSELDFVEYVRRGYGLAGIEGSCGPGIGVPLRFPSWIQVGNGSYGYFVRYSI